MAEYYTDLRDTLLPTAPVAVLAISASAGFTPDVVSAYKASNDLSLFSKTVRLGLFVRHCFKFLYNLSIFVCIRFGKADSHTSYSSRGIV